MRKILVVDDEASVRGLLVSALTSPECEVLDAEDASEALELARQHECFDLVVTDIVMPGMGGFELARRLQRGHNARRFLFVSGFTDIESIDSALAEFERADFLYKPFAIFELLRVVEHLCEPLAAAPPFNPLQHPA
jgi:two-component system cell cycle sensor histidine kinase/response regulator CckA